VANLTLQSIIPLAMWNDEYQKQYVIVLDNIHASTELICHKKYKTLTNYNCTDK